MRGRGRDMVVRLSGVLDDPDGWGDMLDEESISLEFRRFRSIGIRDMALLRAIPSSSPNSYIVPFTYRSS